MTYDRIFEVTITGKNKEGLPTEADVLKALEESLYPILNNKLVEVKDTFRGD